MYMYVCVCKYRYMHTCSFILYRERCRGYAVVFGFSMRLSMVSYDFAFTTCFKYVYLKSIDCLRTYTHICTHICTMYNWVEIGQTGRHTIRVLARNVVGVDCCEAVAEGWGEGSGNSISS